MEAAAFFTVSEALTNVARYAQATVAHVDVRTRRRPRWRSRSPTTASAAPRPAAGSGLRGLADRLGALGGELRVGLAARGGARGCRPRSRSPSPSPSPRRRPGARPAETGALRRRILQSHAVVYALVMALLVFIWLTTGAGYFWPQWAIVGWGLLLALHAWFARGASRGMLDRQTHPDR